MNAFFRKANCNKCNKSIEINLESKKVNCPHCKALNEITVKVEVINYRMFYEHAYHNTYTKVHGRIRQI